MSPDVGTGGRHGSHPRSRGASARGVSAGILFLVMLATHVLLAQTTELAVWVRTVTALGAGLIGATLTHHLLSRPRRPR